MVGLVDTTTWKKEMGPKSSSRVIIRLATPSITPTLESIGVTTAGSEGGGSERGVGKGKGVKGE